MFAARYAQRVGKTLFGTPLIPVSESGVVEVGEVDGICQERIRARGAVCPMTCTDELQKFIFRIVRVGVRNLDQMLSPLVPEASLVEDRRRNCRDERPRIDLRRPKDDASEWTIGERRWISFGRHALTGARQRELVPGVEVVIDSEIDLVPLDVYAVAARAIDAAVCRTNR